MTYTPPLHMARVHDQGRVREGVGTHFYTRMHASKVESSGIKCNENGRNTHTSASELYSEVTPNTICHQSHASRFRITTTHAPTRTRTRTPAPAPTHTPTPTPKLPTTTSRLPHPTQGCGCVAPTCTRQVPYPTHTPTLPGGVGAWPLHVPDRYPTIPIHLPYPGVWVRGHLILVNYFLT